MILASNTLVMRLQDQGIRTITNYEVYGSDAGQLTFNAAAVMSFAVSNDLILVLFAEVRYGPSPRSFSIFTATELEILARCSGKKL
ncbi:hypothetical protein EYZ11_011415 [Aspergillus tanneri]|uniref:Uncharacterized protein n=1 Tax=Aspergillus tanneri TaxID=1220188 RepID=A0A4S3J373_9EURO|nr:hypothetical protein EYZ11_011415 [Aspergillus tanneri]